MNNRSVHSRIETLKIVGLSALFMGAALLGAMEASAHGYVSSPKSRALLCREGIDNSQSAACTAAVAAGYGGIYEPQAVMLGGANDNHQQLIPDGKLCSGGTPSNFDGLNLARNDWTATPVTAGPLTFTWSQIARHKTAYFRYYITKEGFDPAAAPLKWSDLEQIYQSEPVGQETFSNHVVNLPPRTGKHIVYSIWQRDKNDAPVGYYQCVDVVYPNTSSSSVTSSSSSSVAPLSGCYNLPTWNATAVYTNPQQVQHNNKRYQANYWTLGNNPEQNSGQFSYWLDLGDCALASSSRSSVVITPSSSSRSSSSAISSSSSSSSLSLCDYPTYTNGNSYALGALVKAGDSAYRCNVSGWCSTGGPYSPGSGWAWQNAWTFVRKCL